MKLSSGWDTSIRGRRHNGKPMSIITISHEAFGDGRAVAAISCPKAATPYERYLTLIDVIL